MLVSPEAARRLGSIVSTARRRGKTAALLGRGRRVILVDNAE